MLQLVLALLSCAAAAAKQLKDEPSLLALIDKNSDLATHMADHVAAINEHVGGRLPIVAAVQKHNLQVTALLMQYGASAEEKQSIDGHSAISAAIVGNAPLQIVTELLLYGPANLDTLHNGKPLRSYAKSNEIKQLLARFDEDGAAAFEVLPRVLMPAAVSPLLHAQ